MISITEDTLNVIYLYIPSCAAGFGLVLNLLTLAALLRAIGCLANVSTGIGNSDHSEAAAVASSAKSSAGTRLVPCTHFLVVLLLANDVVVLLRRPALYLELITQRRHRTFKFVLPTSCTCLVNLPTVRIAFWCRQVECAFAKLSWCGSGCLKFPVAFLNTSCL